MITSNSIINATFLKSITSGLRDQILTNIAEHYQIDQAQAYCEVTSEESEHLLDYLTGPIRQVSYGVMKSMQLDSVDRARDRDPAITQHMYSIPEVNMRLFTHRMAVIAKRANKLGFKPPNFDIITTRRLKHKDNLVVNDVIVSGEQPQVNGWRFVAKIEHMGQGGTFVTRGNLPNHLYGCPPKCEHCKKNRQRNFTYVMQSTETGDHIQIGKSCMSDFNNGDDPHNQAMMFQCWLDLHDDLSDIEENYDRVGSLNQALSECPLDVLNLAAYICIESSWISSSKAEEMRILSSASEIKRELCDPKASDSMSRKIQLKHKALAEETLNWLKSEQFNDMAAGSRFLMNLSVLANQDVLLERHIGIFSSAVSVYLHHKNTLESMLTTTSDSDSEFIGTEGMKLASHNVRVLGKHFIPNDYGGKTLYRFRDEVGNILVWFSSASTALARVGDTIHINASVKEHTLYNGVKQTALQRVTSNELVLFDKLLAHCDAPTKKSELELVKCLKLPLNLNYSLRRLEQTPLMYAAQSGNITAVRLLLEAGADTDPIIGSRDTALSLAAGAGFLDCTLLLKEYGADQDAVVAKQGISVEKMLDLYSHDLKSEVANRTQHRSPELLDQIDRCTWSVTKEFQLDRLPVPEEGWKVWLDQQINSLTSDDLSSRRYWENLKKGMLSEPITVMTNGNKWTIADGKKRIAAAIISGITHYPANVGVPAPFRAIDLDITPSQN